MAYPALVIGYNKPDAIRKRCQELHELGFYPIYVFVDGSKTEEDSESVRRTHRVASRLLESAKIQNLYIPQSNLGQGVGIPLAIEWFFDNVKEGLILEDDCALSPSTSDFLELAVPFLKSNSRFSCICLTNINPQQDSAPTKLIVSRLFESWGWYSTRERWIHYFSDELPERQNLNLQIRLSGNGRFTIALFNKIFWDQVEMVRTGRQKTWAIKFTSGILKLGGFCIFPNINLVSHQASSTSEHVKETPKWISGLRLQTWRQDPKAVQFALETPDITLENFTLRNMYGATIFRYFLGWVNRLRAES